MELKRLIFIILISLFSILLYSETIKISTSRGEKTLIIPDTYTELKIAYIDMAKLYVEERYDHDKTLKQLDNLLEVVDTLYLSMDKLSKINNNLSNIAIKLTNKKLFQLSIMGGIDYNFLNSIPYPAIGLSIYFNEIITIGLLYKIPINIEILLSWRLE